MSQLTTAKIFGPGIVARAEWLAIFLIRGRLVTRCLSRGVKTSSNRLGHRSVHVHVIMYTTQGHCVGGELPIYGMNAESSLLVCVMQMAA